MQRVLTNSVKHAEAKHEKLHVHSKNDNIEFFMADDGKDMSEDAGNHTGQGLRNIKMRAKKLNAELKFHHENGFGLSLRLRLSR